MENWPSNIFRTEPFRTMDGQAVGPVDQSRLCVLSVQGVRCQAQGTIACDASECVVGLGMLVGA